MARRVYEINPMFNIPEGMEDYVYEEQFNPVGFVDYDEESILDDTETVEELDVPSTLVVVEQIIRTLPDGTQVVDLVVDVEDIPGAETYEFRIVKV